MRLFSQPFVVYRREFGLNRMAGFVRDQAFVWTLPKIMEDAHVEIVRFMGPCGSNCLNVTIVDKALIK
jgi:hypothetical protein